MGLCPSAENDLNNDFSTIPGENPIKVVVVGNTTVGKTKLITRWLKDDFKDSYEPSILDVYRGMKNFGGKRLLVEVHDTSGAVNRTIQYDSSADIFLICVACDDRASLESAEGYHTEITRSIIDEP